MKSLSETEAKEFADTNTPQLENESDLFDIDLPIPYDAGHKRALVRRLVALLPDDKDICVHITAWGIWPSNQNLRLFELVRRGMGEARSIHEVPAHIFSPDEFETLDAFCCLIVYFLWDAWIVSAGGDVRIRLSHDEFVDVSYVRPAEEVKEELAKLAAEER
jgi:hypothetical protein